MVAKNLIVFLVIFFILPNSHSEIYRWIDDNGKVQFSDRPLNNKTKKLDVDTRQNSYGGILKRQRELLNEYQSNDVQQQQEKRQAAAQAVKDERLQVRCINAKDRLRNYQRGALYRLDENGERIFYSEEDRTKAINKYQQLIQKNC